MGQSVFAYLSELISLSDERTMLRIQKNDDHRAFALLVQRWENRIKSLCQRQTGDAHLAQDLTQDVFTRVYAHRKDYRGSGRFSTFIWRIALNACYDEHRRRQRHRQESLTHDKGEFWADGMELADSEPPPDEALTKREDVNQLRQALMRLSQSRRAVVILRHYEGLKFREIAEVLDIAEGTVKSRMAQALNELRRYMQPAWENQKKPNNHQPVKFNPNRREVMI